MTDFSWLGPVIDARDRFAAERAALLGDLRALPPGGWRSPAVPGWSVRDVAAHLLGDDYARLSMQRDGHRDGPPFLPGEGLAAYIHRTNQEWVDACARLSPRALTDTLELTGAAIAELFRTSDPHAPALGVNWAGVDPAPLWLDCAREFTEHWTHRQQIRHATGLGTDPDPAALGLVLDTFMRALPHTLRDTPAEDGVQVRVDVDGPGGGTWTVTAGNGRWSLAPAPAGTPAAVVRLDPETAWLLCTRGIEPETALERAGLEGDERLGAAVCHIVSIVY
ncbi:maleylpyruvate isomerase family mycothiol-dependent enzyme [Nonomuraea sp. NN258]|uniref:maleylpyruvate isomerase family mycothiol-dependent enzyme n=1 Tax=Nonomuraea antri TaxID=2730852 RepID=UPI001569B971|nr:maleylpyruvate isomerase family mycothiol-dependent enzyme [Nonomuraea antri]NRQ34661.1 maleylpyruvate isomerase family mycothiol-dependent enzyme [Nonomuraea antri]